MRIRKLYLKDIGPFDEVEFEFKPQQSGRAEIHILTGPNGCGKTTTLQALTNCEGVRNSELLAKRFRSGVSSEIQIFMTESPELNPKIVRIRPKDLPKSGIPNILNTQSKKRKWAAFAYTGYRIVASSKINAIQDFPENPLSEALDFNKRSTRGDGAIPFLGNSGAFTINQWIANNISKRALEKEKANTNQANKYASSIERLENVISEIIGYKINFDLRTSPLSLVVLANNTELDFDVLPDGLRSAISWIGDVLMRLDLISWEEDHPVNEQNIILFLDEIEVHLHPAWQRRILPAVQKLFSNAQIFLTTHSPFVVNSVDGAWIYELKVKEGKAYLGEVTQSKSGTSYQNVLREVFDIDEDFGAPAQADLDKFYQSRDAILQGDEVNETAFLRLAKKLAQQGVELQNIVIFELRQLNKIKNKTYEI
ncbi:MAG: AAA family ATPase [Acidobacteria bacterium]|nr:AAA family ATPase [Acidobacteriota bacterium]